MGYFIKNNTGSDKWWRGLLVLPATYRGIPSFDIESFKANTILKLAVEASEATIATADDGTQDLSVESAILEFFLPGV